MEEEILRRKWGWLGRTLRKLTNNITHQALIWNPQGRRKRGRPRNSWRQDLNKEVAETGMGWRQMLAAVQDRKRWRGVVNGLSTRRRDGP